MQLFSVFKFLWVYLEREIVFNQQLKMTDLLAFRHLDQLLLVDRPQSKEDQKSARELGHKVQNSQPSKSLQESMSFI